MRAKPVLPLVVGFETLGNILLRLGRILLLALLCGPAFTGCRPRADGPKSIVIQVITNSTEIAAARKAWAEEREKQLAALLERPEGIRSYNAESLALVHSQAERSTEALTKLRDDASRPAPVRIRAACALKFLDRMPSPEQLTKLGKTDTEAAKALLSELQGGGLYPAKAPLPEELQDFVVATIGSPDPRVRATAARVAAWRKVSKAGPVLLALLQPPAKPDPELLRAAARLCPSADILGRLETQLAGATPLSGSGTLGAIVDLAESTGDEALRQNAARICVRHLKEQADQPWIDGETMSAVHMVGGLQPPSTAQALLADLTSSGKWRNMRELALRELNKLDPGLAGQLAKTHRLDLKSWGKTPAGAKPEPKAADIAAICVRHGLLAREEAERALAEAAKPAGNKEEPGSARASAEAWLCAAGRFLTFDVETSMSPNRHDLLLGEFAKASAGRFRPEAALESYQDPYTQDKSAGKGRWVEVGKGKYSVQFIHHDRLYRFEPRDFGDWYDVPAVLKAIHKALADAGTAERFVPLDSGGQDATFIFGLPASVAAAASELGLKLGKDADQARKSGLEFEERVRKQLK